FKPRTDSERALWAKFHHAAVVHVVLMTAALISLILVLQRGYEPAQPVGSVWLAVLPGAIFFSLNRFDILPALATALGFACLGRGRRGWSGAWFALGVLLKIYPVLFVPILLRHLGPARGARWLAGFAATMLFGVGLSTAILGWEPTIQPILVQMSRPYEETRTLYGRVLPTALANSGIGRLAVLGAIGSALVVGRPADLLGVLRRCAIILTVFLALAVFWSPQWVVWYLPLLVPLAARHCWLPWVAAALDLLNYLQFPVIFWVLWGHFPDMLMRVCIEICIGTRIACWAALAGGLAWFEFRSTDAKQQLGGNATQ
ncbi:MAG TPA: glycosyltransferase family 87 protein, partial [Urbifossiella sp.]